MLAKSSFLILALPTLLLRGAGAALTPAPFFSSLSEPVRNSNEGKARSSHTVTSVIDLSHVDNVEEHHSPRRERRVEQTPVYKAPHYPTPAPTHYSTPAPTHYPAPAPTQYPIMEHPPAPTHYPEHPPAPTHFPEYPPASTHYPPAPKDPKIVKSASGSKGSKSSKHEKVVKDGSKDYKSSKGSKSSKADPIHPSKPQYPGCECVEYDPCKCDDYSDDAYPPYEDTKPIQFVMVRVEGGSTYPDSFGMADTLALNGKVYYWKDYDSKVMQSEPAGSFVGICTGVSTSGGLLCTYEILLEKTSNDGFGAFVSSGPNYEKESNLVVTGLAYDFATYSGGKLVTTVDTVHPYLYATLYLLK